MGCVVLWCGGVDISLSIAPWATQTEARLSTITENEGPLLHALIASFLNFQTQI
jgi:hypothetical protein